MSNTDAAVSKPKSGTKGPTFTQKGTLPPDQLKRHKLDKRVMLEGQNFTINGDFVDINREEKDFYGFAQRNFVKNTVELIGVYRTLVHGVTTNRVARSLVLGAQYFSQPFKPEFKRRDAAAAPETEVAQPS